MPSHRPNRNSTAYLDGIRLRYGNEHMRNVFHDATERDNENAARMINDNNIGFPTVFALRPEISKTNMYARLNPRNRHALDLSHAILTSGEEGGRTRIGGDRETLSWMLRSGSKCDSLGEQYDQVLDTSALMLARVHKDRACMQPIAEMMFNRHRKGLYTYDLIWAFFEASEPDDLLLLAEGLRSPDPKDAELARKLLNFVPCLKRAGSPTQQYRCCTQWIRRNRGRLVYTGETNQLHSNPVRYTLADGGRYGDG